MIQPAGPLTGCLEKAAILSVLAAALLSAAPRLAAQQETPERQLPAIENREPRAPTADGERDAAAEAAAEVAAGAPETADAEPEDPFDYEASEQISEDLSVSFPVDI